MKEKLDVHLDDKTIGSLRFEASGNRQACAFEYSRDWLVRKDRFQIDPELPLVAGPQYPTKSKVSAFFGCFADSEPDGWAALVIRRDHAKQRKAAAAVGAPFDDRPLNSLDYLCAVDDFSRIGALRLSDNDGIFVRSHEPGERAAPPLIELDDLIRASKAVENETETARDLRFLLGIGTSIGGMRPKASILDEHGALCIGKFPSVNDERSIVKAEVLALKLAEKAGIQASDGRVVTTDDGVSVAVVKRFDRQGDKRLMYWSARTLLGVRDDQEHTYTEIAEAIIRSGNRVEEDLHQLWRRIVFNVLISNADDHLNNHGFLHVANGRWRLSPAFDINPFPERAKVLKTWISEEGNEASIDLAMSAARYFKLKEERAKQIVVEVESAVSQWREVARQPEIGMTARECDAFEDAFEHEQRKIASDLAKDSTGIRP
ncbi:type II toxin-antitoxin system HipA family toxin [Bradyrhizobium erythrophlei]|uniref:type II toxin-antitoxin system HipA family toxin n=1 Tax=Bradyrhizobium erythrophlei TaxID=1437360 RepID=UPI0035E95B94